MSWIINIDNVSKLYRTGTSPTLKGTLFEQLMRRFTSKSKAGGTNEENLLQPEGSVVSQAQTEGLPPGYFWALKDIRCQIKPGERVGIIGQNGSGKSTLLKILSRITAPTVGEVRYKGHLISLLEVGTGFHSELSGRDNIYLNAAINGMTRQQINLLFKDILDFSELGNQIDTPVKRYSSGMYMRLAFSVAAFLESEILLIDEVLAVGDADFQKKCKAKMLEVANDGRTVIFVSHDMSAIESICNKTIELSHGQIVNTKDLTLESNKTKPLLLDLTAEQNQSDVQINPPIRLKTCLLLNDKGRPQSVFGLNDTIAVEIKFQLVKALAYIVELQISLPDGSPLFSALHPTNEETKPISQPGLYTKQAFLPKELFNYGEFNINLIFHDALTKQPIVNIQNCALIEIKDKAENPETMPLKGFIRAQLNWQKTCEVTETTLETEMATE